MTYHYIERNPSTNQDSAATSGIVSEDENGFLFRNTLTMDESMRVVYNSYGRSGNLPEGKSIVERAYSETGRWWRCQGDGTISLIPEGEQVTVNELMLQALGEITPGTPPVRSDPENAVKLVQVPTIFSIDPAYWTKDSRTVTAGRVTVTATIDPMQSVWLPGEEGQTQLTCDGPGKQFALGTDYKTYPCQHTYKWATPPGEAYDLTTTAVFAVSGSTNAPQAMGPYNNLRITTTNSIEVGEVHAVVVAESAG